MAVVLTVQTVPMPPFGLLVNLDRKVDLLGRSEILAHQPRQQSTVPHYMMGCLPFSSTIPVCLPLLIFIFIGYKILTFARNWSPETLLMEIRSYSKSKSKTNTLSLVHYVKAFHAPIYILQL